MKKVMFTVRIRPTAQPRPHRRPDPHRYARPLANIALVSLVVLVLLGLWLIPVALANTICDLAGW